MHLPTALRQVVPRVVVAETRRRVRAGGGLGRNSCSDTGGPKDADMLASLRRRSRELGRLRIEHRAALVRNVQEGSSKG